MDIREWIRRATGRPTPTVEAVEATLGKSPIGAALLETGRRHNAHVLIVPEGELEPGTLGQITIVNGEVKIAIGERQSIHMMVTSLAHELQHLTQFYNGQHPTAAPNDESDYVAMGLQNEAEAETAANGAAYELSQLGVAGPAREMSKQNSPQWELYSGLRQSGHSHVSAAQHSEPLWRSNTDRLDAYIRKFQTEWAEANDIGLTTKNRTIVSPDADRDEVERTQRSTGMDRYRTLRDRMRNSEGGRTDATPEVGLARTRGRNGRTR